MREVAIMTERDSRPDRTSSSASRNSSPRKESSNSPRKPTGPNASRRREDLPARGGSSSRPGAPRQTRDGSNPRGARPAPIQREQSRLRPRIFEPDIPEEVTGEELEKSVRAELLSLSPENAKVVARHLVCINLYQDSDPLLAHKHGIAAAHHAGRLAVVRETAGYAAYRAGYFEIALKELRAAFRISGDVSSLPVMADCERGLGNPLKALTLAGSADVKKLAKPEEIEMRIVAAGARRDLGEFEAAVVTLTCKELNNESDNWAIRLRYAYADALESAGRIEESKLWFSKCAQLDREDSTDASERAQD